jgi:hypothetical protein
MMTGLEINRKGTHMQAKMYLVDSTSKIEDAYELGRLRFYELLLTTF